MNILAFDTSNNTCSVAISANDKILAYVEDVEPSQQAERLIVMIEAALLKASLSYKQINYLGVTSGPGSFTGIRIGLAAAKGILMAAENIKPLAVTNFEIIHYRAKQQAPNNDQIVILQNAYRNQIYTQIFAGDKPLTNPALINYQELTEILNPSITYTCIGNGLDLVYEQLKTLPNVRILPRFQRIKAIYICRYIASLGEEINETLIEPLYIRPPDAKIKVKN